MRKCQNHKNPKSTEQRRKWVPGNCKENEHTERKLHTSNSSALFWEVRRCQAFAQDKCPDTFPLFSKIDVNGENEVESDHGMWLKLVAINHP